MLAGFDAAFAPVELPFFGGSTANNTHAVSGPSSSAGLTRINLRRKVESMLAGFDAAFARVKSLWRIFGPTRNYAHVPSDAVGARHRNDYVQEAPKLFERAFVEILCYRR